MKAKAVCQNQNCKIKKIVLINFKLKFRFVFNDISRKFSLEDHDKNFCFHLTHQELTRVS